MNYEGKRCIPYYRVSTDDQAERYSLGVQQQLMEQWAERNQVILDQHFIDDHSAKDFRRPGFTKLMTYIKSNSSYIDYVLIIDWSRFSRNIQESYIKIHELEQMGVHVQAIEQQIDESIPESTIMKAIFLAAPDAENKRRSVNVIKGMRQSLKSGNWCGGKVPRGYWRDRNNMELKTTQEGNMIALAYDKIANSNYSIKEAQSFLNLRGVDVTFKALTKMLRNPFYKGIISHKLLGDELVKGNHPAIVTEATWSRVQEILEGNKKTGGSEDIFPLKGFVTCVRCGKSYTAYQIKKKQKPDGTYRVKKSQPIYYKCQCSNISGNKMHTQFIDMLQDLCLDHSLVSGFKRILAETFLKLSDIQKTDETTLKKQLTEKNTFLEKLEEKFIMGSVDPETYDRQRNKTHRIINELKKQMANVKNLSNPTGFVDFSMKMITEIHLIWQESYISEKRRLQNLVFPEGLKYDKPNSHYLTPRINAIFTLVRQIEGDLTKKTRPTTSVNLVYSTSVVRRGIEPLLPG